MRLTEQRKDRAESTGKVMHMPILKERLVICIIDDNTNLNV